jgi:hypothetical protein
VPRLLLLWVFLGGEVDVFEDGRGCGVGFVVKNIFFCVSQDVMVDPPAVESTESRCALKVRVRTHNSQTTPISL